MTLAPVPASDRLAVVDALRGLALLGIFLMNLASFTGYVFLEPDAMRAVPTAALDFPVAFVLVALAMGKFYSLFSLLFGFGFALQLESAARRGDAGGLARFRRRLAVLFLIGACHSVFWEGDIVAFYALMGFLLIPFRAMSPRRLVQIAVVLLIAPVGLAAAIDVSGGALDPGAWLLRQGELTQAALGFAADATPDEVLGTAGWGEYLRYQVAGPLFRYGDLLQSGRPFKVLAMFLLGLVVGGCGLLRDLDAHLPLLRRVRAAGFLVGVPASLVQAAFALRVVGVPAAPRAAEAAVYALAVAPLALAYAATVLLAWRSPRWQARLERLAPAGRMALTSYLTQTAVAVLTFYGVGLGLMGRVGPSLWTVFAVAVFTGQVAFSRWWLERFQFGPAEWIWRQATYGRRLPLRRPAPIQVPLQPAD